MNPQSSPVIVHKAHCSSKTKLPCHRLQNQDLTLSISDITRGETHALSKLVGDHCQPGDPCCFQTLYLVTSLKWIFQKLGHLNVKAQSRREGRHCFPADFLTCQHHIIDSVSVWCCLSFCVGILQRAQWDQ